MSSSQVLSAYQASQCDKKNFACLSEESPPDSDLDTTAAHDRQISLSSSTNTYPVKQKFKQSECYLMSGDRMIKQSNGYEKKGKLDCLLNYQQQVCQSGRSSSASTTTNSDLAPLMISEATIAEEVDDKKEYFQNHAACEDSFISFVSHVRESDLLSFDKFDMKQEEASQTPKEEFSQNNILSEQSEESLDVPTPEEKQTRELQTSQLSASKKKQNERILWTFNRIASQVESSRSVPPSPAQHRRYTDQMTANGYESYNAAKFRNLKENMQQFTVMPFLAPKHKDAAVAVLDGSKTDFIQRARLLFQLTGVTPADVYIELMESMQLKAVYMRMHSFVGLTLDVALRLFLDKVALLGPAENRLELLDDFSQRYFDSYRACSDLNRSGVSADSGAFLEFRSDSQNSRLSSQVYWGCVEMVKGVSSALVLLHYVFCVRDSGIDLKAEAFDTIDTFNAVMKEAFEGVDEMQMDEIKRLSASISRDTLPILFDGPNLMSQSQFSIFDAGVICRLRQIQQYFNAITSDSPSKYKQQAGDTLSGFNNNTETRTRHEAVCLLKLAKKAGGAKVWSIGRKWKRVLLRLNGLQLTGDRCNRNAVVQRQPYRSRPAIFLKINHAFAEVYSRRGAGHCVRVRFVDGSERIISSRNADERDKWLWAINFNAANLSAVVKLPSDSTHTGAMLFKPYFAHFESELPKEAQIVETQKYLKMLEDIEKSIELRSGKNGGFFCSRSSDSGLSKKDLQVLAGIEKENLRCLLYLDYLLGKK